MRILAVDDEPFILELIPLLAAKVGFSDVTTVASGRLALDALVSGGNTFDCLVFDINMPEMDGIELCGRVRQIPSYRTTPIIMLTAMSERDFMDNAFKAGATDYATKPFDIKELGARLRIAQELVTARREAELSRLVHGPASIQPQPLDLTEALLIDGINGFVDFDALKNYLKQSSRAGLSASQVVAFKIDRIEELHARASSDEFMYALRDVAHSVDEALRTVGGLISHAGRGIFVAVSNGATPILSREIEADVQQLLDERNAEYDSGSPMDLEVSVGSPVQPNFGDLADVPRSIERAIARAESRSEAKRDQPRPVSFRLLGL